MPLIEWTDQYIVDKGPIDEQHRKLVGIVNKFDEAMRKGRGSRVMEEILDDLMRYTQEHFEFEESVMRDASYAKLKLHQSQHRQLTQKLEKFRYDFLNQGRRVTGDVRELLKYWLASHILKEDKEYVASQVQETVPLTSSG